MTEVRAGTPGTGSTLATRLALAFLAVALAAVALLAILTSVMAAADVGSLATRQRTDLTTAVAAAAAAAWERDRTWTGARHSTLPAGSGRKCRCATATVPS